MCIRRITSEKVGKNMSNQTQFNEVAKKVLPILTQYVPVVDRVHGDHHPEFHEVRRLYNSLAKKVKESEIPDITFELKQLRKTTNDFEIPSDVCETFEAVYNMLKELSDAYQA